MNFLGKGFVLLMATAIAASASAVGFTENFSSWNTQGNNPNGSWIVSYNTGSNTSDTNGWTVDGNAGTGVDLIGPGYNPSTTPDTGAWLDLAGTPGPGGIERTLTVPTGTYSLSFIGFSDDGQGFSVYLNGTSLHTYSAADLTTGWTTQTLTLNITSANSVLKFYATDPTNGNVGLDSINLQPAPEPFSMSIVGGALFFAVKRRLKRSN